MVYQTAPMLVSYLSPVKNILVPEKCPYMFAVCIALAKVTMNQMETTRIRLRYVWATLGRYHHNGHTCTSS